MAAFGKLDNLVLCDEKQLLPPELDAGNDDSPWARRRWKPAVASTNRAALAELHKALPASLPPLYEQLVLSYRWLEVELRDFAILFANPPGNGLKALLAKMTCDRAMTDVLFPLGLIPFGQASDGRYDPVCFDTARRAGRGDCPVMRIEHEAVLCNQRVSDSWEIAGSFRSFVEAVVAKADE